MKGKEERQRERGRDRERERERGCVVASRRSLRACIIYTRMYTRAHVCARAISNNRVSGEIFIIAGGDTKAVEDTSLR